MTNRTLLLAIVLFALLVTAYVAYYLAQPAAVQWVLKDMHAIGLAVPAAVLAYLFQLRLSRLSRLDAWVRDYQGILKEIAEWGAVSHGDGQYTAEDAGKVSRWYSQALALTAVLEALGLSTGDSDEHMGSIRGLCATLYQQHACPPGQSWQDGLVRHFMSEFYEHATKASPFIGSLYR